MLETPKDHSTIDILTDLLYNEEVIIYEYDTMDNQQARHIVYIAYSYDGRAYIGMKSCLSLAEFEAYTTSATCTSFEYMYKETVAEFDNAKDAWTLEQSLIDSLGALNKTLFANKAKTPFAGTIRGESRTAKDKKAISDAVKLAMADPELRQYLSEKNKEFLANKGHPRKGATLSDEQKKKSVNTRLANNNGVYTTYTPETLAKISRGSIRGCIRRLEKCLETNTTYTGNKPLSEEARLRYEKSLAEKICKLQRLERELVQSSDWKQVGN